MQRILKYGDIQNNILTADKELNILVYWTPSYAIMYRSFKNGPVVLDHPVDMSYV